MRLPVMVFDLGGVLIDWDPRHLYRKIFAEEREMERFLDETGFAEWNSRQDEGRPFAPAVAELAGRFPARAALIHAFWERWEETLAGPVSGTVSILERLRRRGHPLYALSNWSAETFPRARPLFQFLEWFEWILISGDVGTRKPGTEIFRLFLARTRLEAADCVFVDDTPANVEAARRLGFRAIHFRSPERLEDDLTAMGIVVRR